MKDKLFKSFMNGILQHTIDKIIKLIAKVKIKKYKMILTLIH